MKITQVIYLDESGERELHRCGLVLGKHRIGLSVVIDSVGYEVLGDAVQGSTRVVNLRPCEMCPTCGLKRPGECRCGAVKGSR